MTTQDKTELLYKKFLGTPDGIPGTSYVGELGSARINLFAQTQLYSQPIPQIAPVSTDFIVSGYVTLVGGKTTIVQTDPGSVKLGTIKTSKSYPWLQKIDYLQLQQATPYSYYFNNPVSSINLLQNIIPFNYDLGGTYNYALYKSGTSFASQASLLPSNPPNWFIDSDAGYLYFPTVANDWSTNFPGVSPVITFYRYNGTMGIPTNLGNFAGAYAQDPTAIAIGNNAGYTGQGANALAIGNYAGAYGQGTGSIAIGTYAGYTGMKQYSIAIGAFAGPTGMSANSIVLNASGTGLAGTGPTGGFYVAPVASYSGSTGPFMLLAYGADKQIVCVTGAALTAMNISSSSSPGGVITGATGSFTSLSATTISTSSITGTTGSFTSLSAISITSNTGSFMNIVSSKIGTNAGSTNQGTNALAFGNSAGSFNQGTNSIAIGAFAGPTGLTANSIVLNASGTGLAGTGPTGGFYVAPVATQANSTSTFFNLLMYGSDNQVVQSNNLKMDASGSITTSGNIGIGASSSSYKLNVEGDLYTGIFLRICNNTTNTWGTESIFNNTRYIKVEGGAEYTNRFQVGAGGVSIGNDYNPPTYDKGGSCGLIVQKFVGIGTPTPLYQLDVNGDARITGAIIAGTITAVNGLEFNVPTASNFINFNFNGMNVAKSTFEGFWIPADGSKSYYCTDTAPNLATGSYNRLFALSATGKSYNDFYNIFQWRVYSGISPLSGLTDIMKLTTTGLTINKSSTSHATLANYELVLGDNSGTLDQSAKILIRGTSGNALTCPSIDFTSYNTITVVQGSIGLYNDGNAGGIFAFLVKASGSGLSGAMQNVMEIRATSANVGRLTFPTTYYVDIVVTGQQVGGFAHSSTDVPLKIITGYGASGSYWFYTGGATWTTTGFQNMSILAYGTISANSGFTLASDIRIKKDIQPAEQGALKVIDSIPIKSYDLIDNYRDGGRTSFNIIAQELIEVFPEAISKGMSYIPSIYSKCQWITVSAYEIEIHINKPHDLVVGDEIEILLEDSSIKECDVTAIINETTFRVKKWDDFKMEITDECFIYGKKVKDFLRVDKTKVSMLALAGTKELHQIVKLQQAQIQEQQKQIIDIRKELDDLKLLVNSLINKPL